MRNPMVEPGLDELRAARAESRGLYWSVGAFSFFANLLMLTGPLYMLQIYDRVLTSRSVATLAALALAALCLGGAFLGTFHRWALEILRRWPEAAGLPRRFSILDTDDQRALTADPLSRIGQPVTG